MYSILQYLNNLNRYPMGIIIYIFQNISFAFNFSQQIHGRLDIRRPYRGTVYLNVRKHNIIKMIMSELDLSHIFK